MSKIRYAVIVEYKGKCSSYFGLNEGERETIIALLNNLRIPYDVYYC